MKLSTFNKRVKPVKLFTALLFKEEKWKRWALERLAEKHGDVELSSEVFPFRETDYYRREMGGGLSKQWFFFKKTILPGELAGIKYDTNCLEAGARKHAGSEGRVVNIDPGYLEFSKIVLASVKDFSHRIYVSDGIFEEVTLIYKGKSFRDLPWTYPDYRKNEVKFFFEIARESFYNESRGKI